jgi:hypothetical protein
MMNAQLMSKTKQFVKENTRAGHSRSSVKLTLGSALFLAKDHYPELGTRSFLSGSHFALHSFLDQGLLSLLPSFSRFSGSLIAQSLK